MLIMGGINNNNNNNNNNGAEECDESGLELGLTLGGGGVGKKNSINIINNNNNNEKIGFNNNNNNISVVKNEKPYYYYSLSSSSSSSSSYLSKPPPTNSNQVVGWPPIRAYRMNSMVSQAKYPISDEFQPTVGKCKIQNEDIDMNSCEGDKNYNIKVEGQIKKSNFVKVNKDGNGIGRKVDLSAHSCYETLALTMEDMFSGVCSTRRSSVKEHDMMVEAKASSKLLNGSSEFVLTYEDKDGDWMLVGDVPWGMFINSVKRLRIMRTAEANGLISSSSVQMQ